MLRTTAPRLSSASGALRGAELPWRAFFSYERPSLAQHRASNNAGAWLHPHPQLARRNRKTTVEWRMHFGHGHRVGTVGAMRELPDWEHSDGTPPPHSNARYALRFHQHSMIAQIIKAGAVV